MKSKYGEKMPSEKREPVLDVLKAALGEVPFPAVPKEEWAYIERELRSQTTAALPADVIGNHPAVDPRMKDRWKGIAYSHVARWSQILYVQDKLVQLMEHHQIPMVILKGTAAAMYYPVPEYRSMGDVDLLVREKDYQKAFRLMRENDYILMEPEDRGEYHYSLEKNGVIFELHRRLANLPDNRAGRFLMESVYDGLEQREWRQIDGYQIPVLPWLQNGLVLLSHIRQHLDQGLGLRQIIDWRMYVEKELDDTRYPAFQQAAGKAGLEPLAVHTTRMCQIYLGLKEDIKWCSGAKDELCQELMDYIFQQGNFGRKISWEGKGAKALSRSGREQLRWMQRQGRRHWRAVQRYPFLGHLAVIYELFRYIAYVMKKDKPIRSLVQDMKAGQRRKRMFKRLHI